MIEKLRRGTGAAVRATLRKASAVRAPKRNRSVDHALQLLLSPLGSEGLDAWRKEVTRTLCELLGAERAVFSLDAPEIAELWSEDYPRAVLDSYAKYYQKIDIGRIRREKQGLEVWNRELIHNGGLAEFEKSEIYRDFLVPNRICDSMGMTVGVPASATPATLFFHNEKRGAASFGAAGVGVMRLLLPAFKAGAREAVRSSHQRHSLANHLDALAEGMRICDLSGAILHQNRAFTRMLLQEPGAAALEATARELVRELIRLVRRPEEHGPAFSPKRFIRKVRTESRQYEIRGTYIGRALFADDVSIAICLLPLASRSALSDQTLQRRYRLTGRELEIARRLAHGQSNKEIAHACGISLHTVRRHAEKIFAKLGANVRGQVGPKLRGD